MELARVEVLRSLEHSFVDLLERDVQRQCHERQEVVGDACDNGRRGREEPPARPEHVETLERIHDEPVVREDRLPGERPDQIGDEERRDDEKQQEVLPPSAAKGDPVGDGITDQQCEQRRDSRVLERADELGAVVPDRVPVVSPRPGERVPEVDVAGLQRLVREEAQRDEEEHREPRDAGREQQVRRQPTMAMEEVHGRVSRRSGSATASGTSGC